MSEGTDKLEREAQNGLMSFVHGWRKGATGSAFNDALKSNADFMAGHEEGRRATQAMYALACKQYATTLNPLR
jgi:hypothetical protein